MFQATLKSSVSISGIGVHSGNLFEIKINPANEDNGIVFIRKDLDGCHNSITANFRNVHSTTMCTTLANSAGAKAVTVEHLSAAFYGLGITNATVEMSGEEIPILDGSAAQFINAMSSVGIQEQSKKRKILRVLEEVKVEDGQKMSSISPYDSFVVNIECDFSEKHLHTRPISYNSLTDDFIKDFASARTFGFFSDVEYLRKNNLARGASLENTIVFDDNGKHMNDGSLRYQDEPLRHKVLDAVGDLSLSQFMIFGNYNGYCSGHKMNIELLKKLLSNFKNYEITEA